MEEGKEIYLDLRKKQLYGRESEKSRLVVEAMREGIKLEHKFPSVDIFELDGGLYRIADGLIGGHHRAIAHYLEDIPLRFRIINSEDETFLKIPICQILLVENYSYQQLYDSLKFLPRDIDERFCKENNLDMKEYLSQ